MMRYRYNGTDYIQSSVRGSRVIGRRLISARQYFFQGQSFDRIQRA